MCNIMSIDLKMALKDTHPSYAELGGSKPMSISNNSLDKLSKKVHVLNHEKKKASEGAYIIEASYFLVTEISIYIAFPGCLAKYSDFDPSYKNCK